MLDRRNFLLGSAEKSTQERHNMCGARKKRSFAREREKQRGKRGECTCEAAVCNDQLTEIGTATQRRELSQLATAAKGHVRACVCREGKKETKRKRRERGSEREREREREKRRGGPAKI